MRAAEYLELRGWVYTMTDTAGHGRCYMDPLRPEDDAVSEADAVTAQLARDATEERQCVSDAIANAASRCARAMGSEADYTAAEIRVHHAAGLARAEWRKQFAVQLEPAPAGDAS